MLKLLLIDLGLITIKLKDIKDDIDESLGTEFTKGKNSSIFPPKPGVDQRRKQQSSASHFDGLSFQWQAVLITAVLVVLS